VRHYANIFEYVLNSYDFSLFSSFFHTFASKKVIISIEDYSMNPSCPRTQQLQGRNACINFLSLCCQLSSDRIVRLNDSLLLQRVENPLLVELNGNYNCQQHRVYIACGYDIMNLMISRFPEFIEASSSSSSSAIGSGPPVGVSSKKQSKKLKKKTLSMTSLTMSSPLASKEDGCWLTQQKEVIDDVIDEDEKYLIEHFASLNELSASCYSSKEYLDFSYLFDPLSSVTSPCSTPSFGSSSLSSASLFPSSSNLLERNFPRFPIPQPITSNGKFSLMISLKTKLIEKISFIVF
jgi:hypothetical protein